MHLVVLLLVTCLTNPCTVTSTHELIMEVSSNSVAMAGQTEA